MASIIASAGNATGTQAPAALLSLDPSLEAPPDCNDPNIADIIRDIATARSCSLLDATAAYLDRWQLSHDRRVAAWNLQVEQDAALARAAEQERDKLAQEAEVARLADAAKKKAKNPDFDSSLVMGSLLVHMPSSLAIDKTRDFKWVPWWHYTARGCEDARNALRTEASRTLDLVSDGEGGLTVTTNSRESPKCVPDELLSWDDILEGKTVFLKVAAQVGWLPELMRSFAQGILNLDNHWMRRVQPYGKLILVRYFAMTRLEFFNRIALGEKAMDISIINEDLIRSLKDEYIREEENRLIASVRGLLLACSPLTMSANNFIFPNHPPFPPF